MADSILRLKVESQEYDNKLKRAAEEMQRYADGCRKAGGTLEYVDDGVLEFTKALGQMETVSKSAKGSINEMTKAFTDLSVQYNKLTDEEKNAPFGQALKSSLDQLKGRIQDGNAELKNIGSSLNNTGGFMEQLAQKFTVNIDAIKLFNLGLKATDAALKVAKDAFFASEASVDEWGRIMKSAEGLYEGFLNAINTGDISGYLTRMDEIVKAAREAYNAMDTLQTMKTIQSPQFSKQEAENNRIRMMIQTGRWISAGDGRKSPLGLKDGDLLSPSQIKTLERQLQNGMNTIVSLTKNELKQTGTAIDKYYNSLARQNGMSLKEFRQGTSNWGAFSDKMAGYEAYKKWDAQARTEFARQGGRGYVNFDKSNPYADYKKWGVFRVDKMGENSYNDLTGLIKQQQSQMSQMYSTMGQAYRTINRAEGITVKGLMGGGSGGGGGKGGTEISLEETIRQAFENAMMKANTNAGSLKVPDVSVGPSDAYQAYAESMAKDFEKPLSPLQKLNEQLADLKENLETAPDTGTYQSIMGEIVKKEKEIADFKGMGDVKKGSEDLAKSWRVASSAINSVGSAMSGLKDPAINIATVIAQSIATIGLAYAENLAGDNTTKGNIWAFIAAAAASTISLATTIAQFHSATGYAEGGMIKGNSYSGDNLMAMGPSGLIGLNAGEVVLNASQQSALAQNLQGSGNRPIRIYGKLSGTDILLSADRTLKTQGKQLAVWNG